MNVLEPIRRTWNTQLFEATLNYQDCLTGNEKQEILMGGREGRGVKEFMSSYMVIIALAKGDRTIIKSVCQIIFHTNHESYLL